MKNASLGEGSGGFDYLVEHIGQMPVDFVVGEAQDTHAPMGEKLGAFRIMRRLFSSEVNAAVHFNSQLTFDAKEVKDELSVRMLSPEFKTRQLPVTQG